MKSALNCTMNDLYQFMVRSPVHDLPHFLENCVSGLINCHIYVVKKFRVSCNILVVEQTSFLYNNPQSDEEEAMPNQKHILKRFPISKFGC